MDEENTRVSALRDRLETGLLAAIPLPPGQRRHGTPPAQHVEHRV